VNAHRIIRYCCFFSLYSWQPEGCDVAAPQRDCHGGVRRARLLAHGEGHLPLVLAPGAHLCTLPAAHNTIQKRTCKPANWIIVDFFHFAHEFLFVCAQETIAETAILIAGGSIGFFQDNIKKLTADMCDVKPTLFCGVPRVFTRIHQGQQIS
jgi:hypothetical protein